MENYLKNKQFTQRFFNLKKVQLEHGVEIWGLSASGRAVGAVRLALPDSLSSLVCNQQHKLPSNATNAITLESPNLAREKAACGS